MPCPVCQEDFREGAIRCAYCDAVVGPDPLTSGEAEEVFRGRQFVLARTPGGTVIYDLRRPGVPIRNLGQDDEAVEAGILELRRLERSMTPRWTLPLLVAVTFTSSFWLLAVLLDTFYEQAPTFGQEDHRAAFADFFISRAGLAYQATVILVGLAALLYFRARFRWRGSE